MENIYKIKMCDHFLKYQWINVYWFRGVLPFFLQNNLYTTINYMKSDTRLGKDLLSSWESLSSWEIHWQKDKPFERERERERVYLAIGKSITKRYSWPFNNKSYSNYNNFRMRQLHTYSNLHVQDKEICKREMTRSLTLKTESCNKNWYKNLIIKYATEGIISNKELYSKIILLDEFKDLTMKEKFVLTFGENWKNKLKSKSIIKNNKYTQYKLDMKIDL